MDYAQTWMLVFLKSSPGFGFKNWRILDILKKKYGRFFKWVKWGIKFMFEELTMFKKIHRRKKSKLRTDTQVSDVVSCINISRYL